MTRKEIIENPEAARVKINELMDTVTWREIQVNTVAGILEEAGVPQSVEVGGVIADNFMHRLHWMMIAFNSLKNRVG